MADVKSGGTEPDHSVHQGKKAAAPFDKYDADVILCSCDSVYFHVWKNILAEASPFFHDLFSLPQPGTSALVQQGQIVSDDGVPVIQVTEDSIVLDSLLRLCYPTADPELETLEKLCPVLEAVKKYMVDAPLRDLRTRLHALAETSPVKVYAIAIYHGWDEEARVAAKCFLNYPLDFSTICAMELDGISAGAYHRLLDYHQRCSQAVAGLTKEFLWLSPDDSRSYLLDHTLCPSSGIIYTWSNTRRNPRKWWIEHMERSGALLKVTPSGKAIASPGWTDQAIEVAMGCPECKRNVLEDMRRFTERFAAEVEKVTSEVELEIKA